VLVAVSLMVSLVSVSSGSLGFVGDGMKVWRRNTNFWNVRNWEGLVDENCSENIFSFPQWMDPSVVAFPSNFIGKQIILPVNGHFVFHSGLTTLSDSGTCHHGRGNNTPTTNPNHFPSKPLLSLHKTLHTSNSHKSLSLSFSA